MANLTTTTDLKQYVLQQMRELDDGTSAYEARVLTQLNRCYRALWMGGLGLDVEEAGTVTFPWARGQYPKVVNLEPSVNTGTVAVTLGSTSGTFSSAPAGSLSGWFFKVDGEPEIYRIASHTGGNTALTLDAAYVGTSNAAAEFDAFKTRYTLSSDVLALCSPLVAYSTDGPSEIAVVSKSVLNRDFPLSDIECDMPSKAGIVWQQEGSLEIQFNRYVDSYERVEAEYIALPAALDEVSSNPLMPIHHRVVIAEFAISILLENVDDDRAMNHLKMAQAGFKKMVKEATGLMSSGNRDFGRIIAREDEQEGRDRFVKTEDGFIIDMGS